MIGKTATLFQLAAAHVNKVNEWMAGRGPSLVYEFRPPDTRCNEDEAPSHRNGPHSVRPVTVSPEMNPTRDQSKAGLLSTLEIHAICRRVSRAPRGPCAILRRGGVNVNSEATTCILFTE